MRVGPVPNAAGTSKLVLHILQYSESGSEYQTDTRTLDSVGILVKEARNGPRPPGRRHVRSTLAHRQNWRKLTNVLMSFVRRAKSAMLTYIWVCRDNRTCWSWIRNRLTDPE
jgi:hypothetical protein